MLELDWPYFLIIAGALLVLAGIIGAIRSRKRVAETETAQEPVAPQREQMPPLQTRRVPPRMRIYHPELKEGADHPQAARRRKRSSRGNGQRA